MLCSMGRQIWGHTAPPRSSCHPCESRRECDAWHGLGCEQDSRDTFPWRCWACSPQGDDGVPPQAPPHLCLAPGVRGLGAWLHTQVWPVAWAACPESGVPGWGEAVAGGPGRLRVTTL